MKTWSSGFPLAPTRTAALRCGLRPARRARRLSGAIRAAGVAPVADVGRYRLAVCSGQTMTIRHARAQELGPWLDWVATKGEVFVRFWLGPGEAAVTLGPGDEREEVERIPAQLRRFLEGRRMTIFDISA